jgi:hypothetical protein
MAEQLLTSSIAAPGFKLVCSTCKEEKDVSAFHKAGNKKRGYQFSCIACRKKVKEKQQASMSPEDWLLLNRKYWLKSQYGISLNDYNTMLKQQNHSCAICKTDETDVFKQVLYVDHCHTTGKIRGLLCMQCNAGLGKFKDSLDMLEAAKDYLRKAKDV